MLCMHHYKYGYDIGRRRDEVKTQYHVSSERQIPNSQSSNRERKGWDGRRSSRVERKPMAPHGPALEAFGELVEFRDSALLEAKPARPRPMSSVVRWMRTARPRLNH